MGMPARRLETTARGAGHARSAGSRLVSAPKCPRRVSGPAEAACRSLFQIAVVALVVLTALALARVTLSAKAAEASIDQLELERSIKAENRVADRLELDKSLLVTPSRIESIAVGMSMTKAPSIRYLSLDPAAVTRPEADAAPGSAPLTRSASITARDAFGGMLSVAMEVTRKEASALLVGDAAVAAAR